MQEAASDGAGGIEVAEAEHRLGLPRLGEGGRPVVLGSTAARGALECLDGLRNFVERQDDLAALVVEAVTGVGGEWARPPEALVWCLSALARSFMASVRRRLRAWVRRRRHEALSIGGRCRVRRPAAPSDRAPAPGIE
ncbi:hypothetical protein ACWC5I_16080 [Kitasatospora sp. NPDC001574]